MGGGVSVGREGGGEGRKVVCGLRWYVCACVEGEGGGEWFRRCVISDVFVDATACVQLIRVAGHLGVRLPATPPPRAPDDEELFVIEGSQKLLCKMGLQIQANTATEASTVRLLRSQACNNRREHRARCTVTSKTRKHKTTAVVDDESGHKQRAGQSRLREPSATNTQKISTKTALPKDRRFSVQFAPPRNQFSTQLERPAL